MLSHDLEPNRAYVEVIRTAHELPKIGPHLVGSVCINGPDRMTTKIEVELFDNVLDGEP